MSTCVQLLPASWAYMGLLVGLILMLLYAEREAYMKDYTKASKKGELLKMVLMTPGAVLLVTGRWVRKRWKK